MATFYHDNSRKAVFDEKVRRSRFRNGPASCEVELLEWSPGDVPAEGRIIETNAQDLHSRPRPRVQIVYCWPSRILCAADAVPSFAPLDLPDTPTGAGISALFDQYHVPPDFISQRLASVTHSFSVVNEGSSYYSHFHFLCKHVTIRDAGGQSPGIADSRGTELSQGDWTWIRNSVFMRWENSDNKDTASVTLILFSYSPQLRSRCQRLWETDMSMVLVDPFSLFVICFDELWLQSQQIVDKVAGVFGTMERTALDLALSSKDQNNDGKHDFVGLHNIAKHIIHLKENADAVSLTMSHLQDFHRELLKQPPQGQAAIPTMKLTGQMLDQKAVQFEVWKLRVSSMQQRMQNIINLSFNVVIQHDSRILKSDSKSMNAIAMVTMAFLPLATIAALFGSQFFDFDQEGRNITVAANFWIFWALIGPLSFGVSLLYYILCFHRNLAQRPLVRFLKLKQGKDS